MAIRHKLPFSIASINSGFSLIEVIVAMAICMLGLAAILQMSNLSQSFARKTSETTELHILCQNRINELLAGLLPLENVNEQPCPEDELTVYSVDVDLQEQLPLALVVVTVRPASDGSSAKPRRGDDVAEKVNRKRETRERQFTIRRWIATRDLPEKEKPSDSSKSVQLPLLPPSSPTDEEDRP